MSLRKIYVYQYIREDGTSSIFCELGNQPISYRSGRVMKRKT